MLVLAAFVDTAAAQVVQLVGAALVLGGFIAAQRGMLDVASRTYLLMNLLGSLILATLAGLGGQFGFLILNTVWAITSLAALLRGARTVA